MQLVIMEEEPERPSPRPSTLNQEEKRAVSRNRGEELGMLSRLLKGDLDWIVMKALEKDRARRYETANGLAMDVQRHLNNEPVVARPPSRVYRFQKLVRRNKLAFAAAAAVAASLVFGIAVSSWEAIRAEKARKQAEQARAGEVKQRQAAEVAREQAQANEQKTKQAQAKEAEQRRLLRRHAYVADMGNAYQAVKDGNLGKATALVERYLRPAP